MKLAAVDIGTNSIKLLVARVQGRRIVPLEERVVITRLGEGLDRTKRIAPHAAERTIEALRRFRAIADRHGAAAFHAAGTRVFRAARNAKQFVRRCARELDLSIRILSARDEARLAYQGACAHLDAASAVDIGGGSTEVILGTQGRLKRSISINLGAVTLTEKFLHSDPFTAPEIDATIDHIRKSCRRLARLPFAAHPLVGIGGTISATAAILGKPRHITLPQVVRLRKRLAGMTAARRLRVRALAPGRADIIVAGLLVLEEILHRHDEHALLVSHQGMRHGLALDFSGPHRRS